MNTFKRLPVTKQNAILDAATECFADRGYYGASIKEICEKADISNGALYKYFKNKEDLFLTVLYKCQEILVNNLYMRHTQIQHSFLEAIESYLEEIIEIYHEYPDYIRVYTNLGSTNMDSFLKKMQSPFTKSANYIHDMVSEARRKGEIKSHMQDNELSFLLDNYFILFLNSLVSAYHDIRFRFFLRMEPGEKLTNRRKIDFILDSLKLLME